MKYMVILKNEALVKYSQTHRNADFLISYIGYVKTSVFWWAASECLIL